MKQILLAAAAVVLVVVLVVFLWPRGEQPGAAEEGPTSAVTPARAVNGTRLSNRLPPADAMDDTERQELTPSQKRAMHRLVQTYQQAQRMVADVEGSEAVKREQETQRFGTDADGIRGAINSRIEDIQRCYESWLMLNPKLAGRIVTGFAIDAEEGEEGARVVDVSLREGGLGNKFLEGCVLSVLSELEFEPPEGRIEVNYPFTFRTAPESEENE